MVWQNINKNSVVTSDASDKNSIEIPYESRADNQKYIDSSFVNFSNGGIIWKHKKILQCRLYIGHYLMFIRVYVPADM